MSARTLLQHKHTTPDINQANEASEMTDSGDTAPIGVPSADASANDETGAAASVPRVLVVDDNPEHRYLLATHLTRAGCAVTAVASAEAAIVAFESETPDIAFVDLQLPIMSGGDLVRWLREAERPQCAVITTSVLDVGDHPVADAALPKPFSRSQINELVREFAPPRRNFDEVSYS